MFADTQPAALDPQGGPDPWGQFRVSHPRERAALLRQLRDGAVPVHIAGAEGSSLTATLWSADERTVAFAVDAGAPALAGLLDADEAVAVAYLEAVKLQFDLHELVLVRGAQASVLQCRAPGDIYRFQRRQAYRVRTDERQGPVARLRHPSLPDMQLALRVLDVSVGGCALWLPDDVPALQPGTEVAGAEIALDAATHFRATLRLQHVTMLGGQRGGHGVRIGCGWQLAAAAERSLQRWIDQAQKRRRLLTLG